MVFKETKSVLRAVKFCSFARARVASDNATKTCVAAVSSSSPRRFQNSIPYTIKSRFSAVPGPLGMLNMCRSYSTSPSKPEANDTSVPSTDPEIGTTWSHIFDSVCETAIDTTSTISGQIFQYIDTYPSAVQFITEAGGAFLIMHYILPRILWKLKNKFATGAYDAYEDCFLHILENASKYSLNFPIYAISLWGFTHLTVAVLPGLHAYMPQIWRVGMVLPGVGFLYMLKTSFISYATINRNALKTDQNWLSAFDKIYSLGLIAVGLLGIAEASGVSLEWLITVSGVGGVATAFAARDILGNILSGLSLQLSRPFSAGEYIKAGSIEGTVLEIGLTSTKLIGPEKLRITVPNSLFAGQIIVNRSRAEWLSFVTKIPIKVENFEKVNAISGEIIHMLMSSQKDILEVDAPYCYLSRLGNSYGELTLGYNLQNMRHDEVLQVQQDILLQAVRIINSHGVELGDPIPSSDLEVLLEAARIIKFGRVEFDSPTR